VDFLLGRRLRAVDLAAGLRLAAGEVPGPAAEAADAESRLIMTRVLLLVVLLAWASPASAAERTVLRRLNRAEYERTICDLLGIHADFRESLPLDTSSHNFDNVGDALHVSSFLMDRYLEAADRALGLAIANGPQPPLVKKRYSLKDTHQVKLSTESVYLKKDDTVICFSSSPWNSVVVSGFYPTDRGRYRIRISAFGHQNGDKPVTYRVDDGPMLMGTKSRHVGYFDAAADKPSVLEFTDHFEARDHVRIHPYGLANAQTVTKVGAEKYTGPGLGVEYMEVEGPLFESWPPPSHTAIFGDLPQITVPMPNNSRRLEVSSKEPAADAERILKRFANRAFRRPATDAEIQPYLALVKRKLDEKQTFEQAVRVGLKAILVSPDFLFLRESTGKLDDFALASRLSYFLWSSMPDKELLKAAESKKLGDPAVLRGQVERMLKSPKAAALTENFLGQWLQLRDIDATAPEYRLYPEWDEMLRESMVKETHLFFEHVLREDLPLTNFTTSDFTFLNERLAKHYGIPGVSGLHMRKVNLPKGSHRGGVLTMASVLKVTANGTNTSPVTRGAWVLDRILGTPPSPPPDGVPAVEPDIRGATTMREQLAKHREIGACAGCHKRIDPPGFALESFDVIGGWRDHYRSVGKGEAVTIDGRRMMYAKGPKVDPSDVLNTGEKFAGIDEFKAILMKNPDKLARGLAKHLLIYATGAVPTANDTAALDALVSQAKSKQYGFRSLIHAIVQSDAFRMK
jgi:hypothetical protein